MKTRRNDICKAAYDLMGTQGLEAVHARTVASEIGINHATVHYYFPRRPDLLVGVAEFALEQFRFDRARFHEGLSTPGDKIEGELALAEAYCKKNSRFAKVLAGLYVSSVEEPLVRKRLQVLWKEWSGLVSELATGAKLRKGTPYADGELLAATLFGFMLTSHMTDGQFDAKTKIDDLFTSMFG